MKRFFMLSVVCAFMCLGSALAQTPQQLEMLKNRSNQPATADDTDSYIALLKETMKKARESKFVYKDEKTGKMVIPVNTNEPTIDLGNGKKVPLPMAKTDAEVRETFRGPNMYIMEQMNDEEKQKYFDYIIQDRIFLNTGNFLVTDTGTGTKLCQMQVQILNNTPRVLRKISLLYVWGDVKMPAEFTNVEPAIATYHEIALAGSVCDIVTKGAKYEVSVCSMDGLSKEQCMIRIAKQ